MSNDEGTGEDGRQDHAQLKFAPCPLAHRFPRSFTFYVAPPIRSIGLAFKRAATFDNVLRPKHWRKKFQIS
jgi:hypothetical protein